MYTHFQEFLYIFYAPIAMAGNRGTMYLLYLKNGGNLHKNLFFNFVSLSEKTLCNLANFK